MQDWGLYFFKYKYLLAILAGQVTVGQERSVKIFDDYEQLNIECQRTSNSGTGPSTSIRLQPKWLTHEF